MVTQKKSPRKHGKASKKRPLSFFFLLLLCFPDGGPLGTSCFPHGCHHGKPCFPHGGLLGQPLVVCSLLWRNNTLTALRHCLHGLAWISRHCALPSRPCIVVVMALPHGLAPCLHGHGLSHIGLGGRTFHYTALTIVPCHAMAIRPCLSGYAMPYLALAARLQYTLVVRPCLSSSAAFLSSVPYGMAMPCSRHGPRSPKKNTLTMCCLPSKEKVARERSHASACCHGWRGKACAMVFFPPPKIL